MPRAHLVYANLRNANLAYTNLQGAFLRGADLRGARNLTQEELEGGGYSFAVTGEGTAMALTLGEAARRCGLSKTSVLRAIKTGRVSGTKGEDGVWMIDESELLRVYPDPVAAPGTGSVIEVLQSQVRDLQERLDAREQERRETQTKLTALLTGPKRKWWRWW